MMRALEVLPLIAMMLTACFPQLPPESDLDTEGAPDNSASQNETTGDVSECVGVRDCEHLSGPCVQVVCIESVCVSQTLDDAPCDDGLACTEDDRCVGTSCVGAPVSCESPGPTCASAACDEGAGGCVARFDECSCQEHADCGPQGRCSSALTCECVADCTAKACGPDGCGGSCGACDTGEECTGTGACVCAPDCAGKQCGNNGCGGLCGNCPTGLVCDAAHQCVVPPCGVLGVTCPTGFSCTGNGTCENPATAEVWVPAGDFWMGCNAEVDDQCAAREHAQHRVALSSYAVDRTPVTAAPYRACVTAGTCQAPSQGVSPQQYATYNTYDPGKGKQDHPINFVNWEMANTYCAWSAKPPGAQRLCTEAEWERAARGGCETVLGDCGDGTQMRKYPWDAGDGATPVEPTCLHANFYDVEPCEPTTFTSPVHARPAAASPYGALEMAGGVWEWVADWYSESYAAESITNPTGPETGTQRVTRGGSFASGPSALRTSTRGFKTPNLSLADTGIRCCRTLP